MCVPIRVLSSGCRFNQIIGPVACCSLLLTDTADHLEKVHVSGTFYLALNRCFCRSGKHFDLNCNKRQITSRVGTKVEEKKRCLPILSWLLFCPG